jgi:hypothetical protein
MTFSPKKKKEASAILKPKCNSSGKSTVKIPYFFSLETPSLLPSCPETKRVGKWSSP